MRRNTSPGYMPLLITVCGVCLIAAAALACYWPSLAGEFILDDNLYLTSSSLIKAPDGLYRFWLTKEPVDYYPVSNSSLWLEWRLWGMNPTGYHVANLCIHIVNSLLVWAVLRRLSVPGAFLAALLFAIHPVNVESVAWIAQRKNILAMLFFLCSIYWYLGDELSADSVTTKHRLAEAKTGHPMPGLLYWLSLAAFGLAMLSKGAAVTLPLLLLLVVWWLRARVTQRDLVRSIPFWIVAIVLLKVQSSFGTLDYDESIGITGPAERLVRAAAAVWFYLYKALLPIDLAFVYPKWRVEAGNPLWWLPLVAAIALTVILLWKRNSWLGRPLLFAWLFYCVALLPALGFVDVGFLEFSQAADHYQYFALPAVLAPASAGTMLLYLRLPNPQFRVALITASAVALSALAWQTGRQASLYSDPVTLYTAALKSNPDCWLVHYNLGLELSKQRDLLVAIGHYQRALSLKHNAPEIETSLGTALVRVGAPKDAVAHFQRALRFNPDSATVHSNLGAALAAAGRPDDAIQQYKLAIKLQPEDSQAYVNIALSYEKIGDLEQATAAAKRALEIARRDHDTQLIQQLQQWLAARNESGAARGYNGKLDGTLSS